MKKISIILIFLIVMSCYEVLATSNKLAYNPVWLNPGKAFTKLDKDERFYFIKFREKMIFDSNEYLIAFLVYSYSPSENMWTVWDYNSDKKDFEPIRSGRFTPDLVIGLNYITNGTRTYENYDIDKMYKVFIRSNSSIQSEDFKDKNNSVFVYPKNFSTKFYFKKHELSSLRLINYNLQANKYSYKKGTEKAVYFDKDGYGVFINFQPQKEPEIVGVTPIRSRTMTPLVKKFEILPENQIQRNGKAYTYFNNFGYVHLNATCYHNNISSKLDYIVTTINKNYIIYSPVKVNRDTFDFFAPIKKNSAIYYLWCKAGEQFQPVGRIYYNQNLYFEFKKNINAMVGKLSKDARTALEKWDAAIKAYNQSDVNDKQIIKDYLSNKDYMINNYFEKFIGYQQSNNQNLLTKISKIPDSKTIHLSAQFLLQELKDRWCLINSQSKPKFIAIPSINGMIQFELEINDNHDKVLYAKTLLYDSLFYSYNRQKIWHYENLLKRIPQKHLKLWIIFDDYVDPERILAKRLYEFKQSFRFYQILFEDKKSSKIEKRVSRVDLIKGSNIIKKALTDYSILESSDIRFSEISALSKLEHHPIDQMNDNWELHLFLAKKTSTPQLNATTLIGDSLKKLNVKRIVIWEFCNYKPSEETIYNVLFRQISNETNIDYVYNQIYSKKQFYSIKMKGYKNEL
ncbi:conserved hypothetical protein, secreted [Candidatus Magnetomorum sp. HK-1]|nr:conserved hypothetical protein, secreted [Candidatus Magnetomorum sp. HK-1]